MTQRDDLRAEFTFHRSFLDDLERSGVDDFASRLAAQQIEARLVEVGSELDAIEAAQLDVRVAGDVAERQSLPAALLVALVGRLQSAYSWASWAFLSGPEVGGSIPTRVGRATTLEVALLPPSSFRIGFRRALAEGAVDSLAFEADASDPRDSAIQSVLVLLEAGERAEFGDSAEEAARDIGREANRRVELLAKSLAGTGAAVDFFLHADQPTRVHLSADGAGRLATWLSDFEEQLETYEVDGVLRIIDTLHGRFGLEDAAGNQITGKAAPELLSGKEADLQRYRARIQTLRRLREHAGPTQERVTLLGLEQIK